ncbi:MAG: hypothetical protein PG981_000197 [Wolbachia endosymbiont of Ctenocephalides orientis wCori]|nr:MAG: hypothetical protein PG981_000197 [Wolbachia endosymbiont of Ctenocephalides orientis wCori]
MGKQERFDELRNLVLQINEVDTVQQNEMINQFSKELDGALQSGFNFAELFHEDCDI